MKYEAREVPGMQCIAIAEVGCMSHGFVHNRNSRPGEPLQEFERQQAALIVRAVNSHDALVNMLDRIHALIDAGSQSADEETRIADLDSMFDEIGRLIADAKGDTPPTA